MAKIESPVDHATRITDNCSLCANVAETDKVFRVNAAAIKTIESRDKAVALALLDKVEAYMRKQSGGSLEYDDGNFIESARSKYGKAGA